jgi:hypothetical protein
MTGLSDPTGLYLKFYPLDPAQLDAVIREVVAPLVAEHEQQWDRWFFLRYLDRIGAHVRLRLRLDGDTADDLAAQCDRLAETLGRLPAPGHDPHAVDAAGWPRGPAVTQVRLALYEPETDKWGGTRYLPRAEQVFQQSSEVALDLLSELRPTAVDRLAAGGLLLDRVLDGLGVVGPSRAEFLRTHFQWWSGGDAAQAEKLRVAARKLQAEVRDRSFALAAEASVRAAGDRFVTALQTGLAERNPAQKPMFVLFHHVHLMLNRLGVIPAEEAVVSLLSRGAEVAI